MYRFFFFFRAQIRLAPQETCPPLKSESDPGITILEFSLNNEYYLKTYFFLGGRFCPDRYFFIAVLVTRHKLHCSPCPALDIGKYHRVLKESESG
jgi:hypothetical protein